MKNPKGVVGGEKAGGVTKQPGERGGCEDADGEDMKSADEGLEV